MLQRTLTIGGSITVRLVSRFLTKQENVLLFVCSEAVEFKHVK